MNPLEMLEQENEHQTMLISNPRGNLESLTTICAFESRRLLLSVNNVCDTIVIFPPFLSNAEKKETFVFLRLDVPSVTTMKQQLWSD